MNKLVEKLDLIHKQIEVLSHLGRGYTELRIPKLKTQKFFEDQKFYYSDAQNYIEGDCYVGINPRKTQSGKAEDVSFLTTIVLDFDPIRPKDVASTDDEHNEALALARQAHVDNTGSVLVDSGSGAHLYIPVNPIEITEAKRATLALQQFTKEVVARYPSKTIKIDSIFDLSRIIRIWGSFNEKSKRLCHPISGLDTYTRIVFDLDKYYRSGLASSTPFTNSPKMDSPITNRFEKLLSVNDNLKNMFNGLGKYSSRSEADFALTSYLISAKFSDQEILDIRKRSPLSKSEDRTDGWILGDIQRIRQKSVVKSKGISTIDDSYFKELDARKPGIMTGFTKLDNMMAGLKGGRLTVISARPSCGKTTLVTQIAKNLAKNKNRVLMFPTECGASVVYDKIISSEASINLGKFQFGNFTKDEQKRIGDISSDIKKLPIFVVENFALKVEDIEKSIKELVPDVVIIDYFNNIVFPNSGKPEDQAVIVSQIKKIALDYNVPIILASQLNRGSEGNALSLTQIKGTGKLEEQADDVMFLSTLDFTTIPRPVNLNIMKSRFGETGLIKMDFFAPTCTFKEKE